MTVRGVTEREKARKKKSSSKESKCWRHRLSKDKGENKKLNEEKTGKVLGKTF